MVKVLVQITKVSVYKISHESERGSEGVDWIHLTFKTVQWWTLWEFANEAAVSRSGGEYPDHLIIS
jgi:hypothetical protein